MNRRRLRQVLVCLAGLFATLGAYWLWDHRGYWLVDNFRAVEPGRIYAGGYQYPRPLARIIDQYQIKTVLSLREGGDEYEAQELDVLRSRGVTFRQVAIPYQVPAEERIAAIEQAIAVMTDERNQPVFVHCWAGCHRTGAVVAIYRVSRCNWTEQRARQELVAWGGTALGTQWPTRILQTYCSREREAVARQPVGDPAR